MRSLKKCLLRERAHTKLSYLIDFVKDSGKDTAILVDGTSSSIFPNRINIYIPMRGLIGKIELYMCLMLNGINPLSVEVLTSSMQLDDSNDLLFGDSNIGGTFNAGLGKGCEFNKFKGRKILHFSHFFKIISAVSANIKDSGVVYGAAEADLTKSPFFKKYYPYIENIYLLPFALEERFKMVAPFEERANKCLAIGSLHDFAITKHTKDYYEYFGRNSLHKMRREIYDHSNDLRGLIDVKIYMYGKERNHSNNRYTVLEELIDFFSAGRQKSYFSFDIVNEYNKYQMFISPEEDVGLPSINFIEGMACGCAYIGVESSIYSDLGLIPSTHYISYDGSIEDLRKKIVYYQNHSSITQKIASEGRRFVCESFGKKNFRQKVWKDLTHFQETDELVSSFYASNL